ncbi:MAG: bifunctional glutamate N-acetyltransferase/amino-acid acetyltransferase ArgJ [bacterium]|nr:bifunctional glutamate N-acetyltransferase/amino-acid acetyltransferase ArgJ [bacterium]
MKLPKGYLCAGLSAGIKQTSKKDLALVYSIVPAVSAGTFTKNRVVAAPVTLSRQVLKKGKCRAILVNSGNANACTGQQGMQDAQTMQKEVSRLLKLFPSQVVVASTGKIGELLPIQKIRKSLPRLVASLSSKRGNEVVEAILTTDRFPKTASFEGTAGGKKYRLVGIAKGAGMIHPNMATMLAFFMTDLAISAKTLNRIFKKGVEHSFNRITVDSDTSTNDMAVILANGLAKNRPLSSSDLLRFEKGLTQVMQELARLIVKDGEGGTKVVTVHVEGARTQKEAEKVAWAIATSPLVKTAFYGQDPNWGRVLAAAGRSGAFFDPARVDLFYNKVPLLKKGRPTGIVGEKNAARLMQKGEFVVTLRLHAGRGAFQVLTSDLTVDYVKLNADYRT